MDTMTSNSGASSSNASDTASLSSATTAQTLADDYSCVVGMACRAPGASNPSKLWENIVNQRDVQSKMPADRFNVDAYFNPEGTNKGTVREGLIF